jgi:hypothetical protein
MLSNQIKTCVANSKSCSLLKKCVKCKKHIKEVNEIEKLFKEIVSEISVLRQSEKIISPTVLEKDAVPK